MDFAVIAEGLEGSTKQKLQALEQLHDFLERFEVSREHLSPLVDATAQLLSDNNHKVALRMLQAWEVIIERHGEEVKPFINALLPPVVERLSDNRQEVRQTACNCMLLLLNVVRPDLLMDKLARFWAHKHWKVRHGMLQFLAEGVCSKGSAVLVATKPGESSSSPVHQAIRMLEDPESAVRDAAFECLEEVYPVIGEQLLDMVAEHSLRPAVRREVYARLQVPADAPAASSSEAAGPAHDHGAGTANSSGAHAFPPSAAARPSDSMWGLDRGTSDTAGPADVRGGAGATAQAAQQQPSRSGSAVPHESSSAGGTLLDTFKGKVGRRRGGFNDGGGITADGELAEAPTLLVSSERELRAEVDRVQAALMLTGDWEKRIAAMLRLEGVIKGGAAAYDAFPEILRPLKDQLVTQISDRRSAVSRQVCHMLGMLAAALGPRFEWLGQALMPALVKMLVITVQVISEAADTCLRTIVHHCHSLKLLQLVCGILAADKNAKLRLHCSSYLLQILEEWDPFLYTKVADQVEASIVKAAQDSLADTRNFGRCAFAAYLAAEPERAAELLARVDSQLQGKLREGVAVYQKGTNGVVSAQVPQLTKPAREAPSRAASAAQRARAAAAAAKAAAEAQQHAPVGYAAMHMPEVTVYAPVQRPQSSRSSGVFVGSSNTSSSMPAPPPPSAQRLVSTSREGGVYRPGRKSLAAGAAMRVPGAGEAVAPDSRVADFMAEARQLQADRKRRNSVMPQRVPQAETSATSAAAVASSRAAASGNEAAQRLTAQSSQSELAGTVSEASHSQGPGRVAAASGVPDGQQQQHLSRATSASDDLGAPEGATGSRDQQLAALSAASAAHGSGSHAAAQAGGGAAGPAAGGATGSKAQAVVVRAVAAIIAVPRTWSEKVDKFNALAEALARQADGSGCDLTPEMERVLPKLLVHMDDPHFKVALAAMGATEAALHACPRALEPSLDKLLPLLFLKLVSSKQQMQAAAETMLQACAMAYTADTLIPPLTHALGAYKAPNYKNGVMEFWVLFIGQGKATGAPTNAAHVRLWVGRVARLLLDKSPDVRAMAAKVLQAAYDMDPAAIDAFLQHASAQELVAVRRALSVPDADDAHNPDSAPQQPSVAALVAAGEQLTLDDALGLLGRSSSSAQQASTFGAPLAAEGSMGYEQPLYQQLQPQASYEYGAGAGSGQLGLQHMGGQDSFGGPAASALATAGSDGLFESSQAAGGYGSGSLGGHEPAGERHMAPLANGGTWDPLTQHMQHSSSNGGSRAQFVPPAAIAAAASASLVATPPAPGAGLPSDPQSQGRYLVVLVHRLQSRPSEEVLGELAEAAARFSRDAWDTEYSKVLLAVLSATKAAHEPTREAAFFAVRALAEHHAHHFLQALDVALHPLLLGCADASREVQMAAHQALDRLVESMPPDQVITILRAKLPSQGALSAGTAADGDVLCAAIRCLQLAARRSLGSELLQRAPGELLPGLFAAFAHPRTDVRKAVTLCLVELWFVIGEPLTPYLSSLATSQLKLLTIYYNRRQEAAVKGGAAAAWQPPVSAAAANGGGLQMLGSSGISGLAVTGGYVQW